MELPFQVIETVNEPRATREAQKTKGYSLFDNYQGPEGVTFEEGCYIDSPFDTGPCRAIRRMNLRTCSKGGNVRLVTPSPLPIGP